MSSRPCALTHRRLTWHPWPLKKQLEDLSQGIIPDQFDDLLDNIKNEKGKWFNIYKESQDFFQERVNQEKITIPAISFDQFYKKDFALKIRMDFTKDIFKRGGLKISEMKINKILVNGKVDNKFPFDGVVTSVK